MHHLMGQVWTRMGQFRPMHMGKIGTMSHRRQNRQQQAKYIPLIPNPSMLKK
jgi:hypothetical protein